MTRPKLDRSSGPAVHDTVSSSMPSSGQWPQYSQDPSGWTSNQPDAYSSYPAGSGEWYDSSATVPWSKSNQQAFTTSQSSGTFSTQNQSPANPAVRPGYQQQHSVSGQTAPGMSKPPSQPGVASGNAYNWNNDPSAGQWQSQSQWPWPQNNNQWQSSQPFQYMVGFYLC